MREIKFRFVNQYKDGSIKMEFMTLEDIENDESWQGTVPYKRIATNQFTGLRDKNGKEIYEGDVVQFEGYWGANDIQKSEVYYHDGYFAPLVHGEEGHTDGGLDRFYPEGYEVIGNIYENPELLKP